MFYQIFEKTIKKNEPSTESKRWGKHHIFICLWPTINAGSTVPSFRIPSSQGNRTSFSGSCRVTGVLSSICPGTAATKGLWPGPAEPVAPAEQTPVPCCCPLPGRPHPPTPLTSCSRIYAVSHKGTWIRCAHRPAGLILATRKNGPLAQWLLPLIWDTQPKYHYLVIKS